MLRATAPEVQDRASPGGFVFTNQFNIIHSATRALDSSAG